MKILLTLDYELFLGQKTGTVENCLIKPMSLLSETLLRYDGRFTIFVDATYLLRLKQLSSSHSQLQQDFNEIVNHLRLLKKQEHDIQLHIHPHWAYSEYHNGSWITDFSHYKLKDLDEDEAIQLTKDAKELLDEIIDAKTTVFRAGGFSAQPTRLLTNIFLATGLVADSSVIPGSCYNSPQQEYDYTSAPTQESIYRFEKDICILSENGQFTEIPISMFKVSPLFHWGLVYNRFAKQSKHVPYGDGISVKTTTSSILSRLLWWQNCHTTIDGYKINFLDKAYKKAKKDGKEAITVLGHPKLATPFSVMKLDEFAQSVVGNRDRFITISDYFNEQDN